MGMALQRVLLKSRQEKLGADPHDPDAGCLQRILLKSRQEEGR